MIILDKKPLDVGRIAHSFRRSKRRVAVYRHMCSIYPGEESISEISAATGYSATDILGIMMGYEGRYEYGDSLVVLGLIKVMEEGYHGKKALIFRARPGWEDVDKALEEYDKHHDLFKKLRRQGNAIGKKSKR